MSAAAASKSARAALTSSDSESSSSSSNDGRHRTITKPSSAAVPKSRLIPSSSDSDDSSDNDVDSVTLLKNRMTPADKSARKMPATLTPVQPRQKIYTSSDNDDDDSDSDSMSVTTPLKKVKPSLSMSTPSSSKFQPKKPTQSATKKPPASTPGKSAFKSCLQRESSTDSDVTAAAKSSKPVMKDAKKQAAKTSDKHSRPDSVLGSSGEMAKKEVKKPPKSSTNNKPVPQPRASSFFIDTLAKSSMHAKVVSKTAGSSRDEKLGRKDSRIVNVHKSTAVSSAADRTKQSKSSHTDVEAVKSKHSVSDGRHAPKSSSGSLEKKVVSERALKPGSDAACENTGQKTLESESIKSKKMKVDEQNGASYGTAEVESDELPLIRPGNIFEKMEKQDSSADKNDEPRMFGHADSATRRRRASEIAVFMPESDDDDDREPLVEPAKLSIERLKEESAKEETIEEAVKAIIEFTKEPSTPPLSSSKATDSEPPEDTSTETADDDLGLSDDVGELNAAIGNLIEKELEPVGGDSVTVHSSSCDKASEEDASAAQYRPATHGGSAEPKNEQSPFVVKSSFKEEHVSVKMEVDSVARHIPTSVHDEQNVTSFMSRLEKATADVVDFASISAAAAASRKLPEKASCREATACSKPEVSSRLFAGSVPMKTEDEKAVVVKKEECCEQTMTVKTEPPELPSSTRIFSPSKQPDVQGVGSAEKGVAAAGTEAGSGEDSSTTADLYEFKDDDDDETHGRQKDFVLHKRSRKRHADSESNDAADVVDSKKSRVAGGGSHVKSDQNEAASAAEQCPPTSTPTSDVQPVSSQSSWRTNMDLVIEAVARGEFERGDDFNYYSSQNAAAGKSRRGRGSSRDDSAAHKPVPASTPACPTSSLPSLPVEAFSPAFPFPRSMSAVTSAARPGDHCSSKLLLPGMPSPQQLQQYRLTPPGSLAATCKFHQLPPATNTGSHVTYLSNCNLFSAFVQLVIGASGF